MSPNGSPTSDALTAHYENMDGKRGALIKLSGLKLSFSCGEEFSFKKLRRLINAMHRVNWTRGARETKNGEQRAGTREADVNQNLN